MVASPRSNSAVDGWGEENGPPERIGQKQSYAGVLGICFALLRCVGQAFPK